MRRYSSSSFIQPLSFVTQPSRPRDPLVLARTLADGFGPLAVELDAVGGIRDRLYAFLQDNYLLGSLFMECPEEYQRFKDEEYWRDAGQKPTDRNVMRSVLAFTMGTKNQKALQNRKCKYARVLEHFHHEEVLSNEIPQRLKDGGGIDAIYATLCHTPGPRDCLEELVAELPLARTSNSTTNDRMSDPPGISAQARLARSEIDDDASLFHIDDLRSIDRGLSQPVRALAGANERTDTFSDEVRYAAKSKPRNRIDLKTTLAVEMFEYWLEEILHAKRATIRVVVEPPDERGLARVIALSVLTSKAVEGPWPDVPAERDGDEPR
jgi:hypothetical protein